MNLTSEKRASSFAGTKEPEILTKPLKVDVRVLLSELKECSKTRNIQRGRELHAEAKQNGSAARNCVASALLHMYARCGNMADARQVFNTIEQPDVVSWTSLILGYAKNGDGHTALELYSRMSSQGSPLPNSVTFLAALQACISLAENEEQSGKEECKQWGRRIHTEIGIQSNMHLNNTLIGMYAKCNSMFEARQVFDSVEIPDIVSWNTLILGYARNGEGSTALLLFARMKAEGCAPNCITYVAALKSCIALSERDRTECLQQGRQIHSEIGIHLDIYVQNTLIDMYSRGYSMDDARKVFDGIDNPNVISWNTIIMGYAENGEGILALELFARMRQCCVPDNVTFVASLKACFSLGIIECLDRGRKIHAEIGNCSDICVQNTLIDMYSKGGSMCEARKVFDSIKVPTVVSWTTLILGYADNGEAAMAMQLFSKMKSQGINPNCITFIAALKACGFLGALESGRKIHAEMELGIERILLTCIVDFYAKCGSLTEAQNVFDSHPETRDTKAWTALMAGYSCQGDYNTVFRLFEGMQDAGFYPDAVTCSCIISSCSRGGLVQEASQFFEAMSTKYRVPLNIDHFNCMVDLLGRSKNLRGAMALLRHKACKPDAVTWMTLLGACRKWKNVEIGRLVFNSLLSSWDCNEINGPAYVLMAHIYGSRGMWKEQVLVLGMKDKLGCLIEPGQSCWTNEMGEIHMFLHVHDEGTYVGSA